MMTNGSPNSTGSLSVTRISRIVPARGAGIGFMVFIASTISRVWPAMTLSRGRGDSGGRRVNLLRRGLAGDTNAKAATLDFNLGQAGVAEDAGQLAHEAGIDRRVRLGGGDRAFGVGHVS